MTPGRDWGRLGRVDLRHGRLRVTDAGDGPAWLSGACFAVHRGLWERLGGMDGDYFLYWEDVDLSLRAQRHGARLVLVDDIVVVHEVGGTQQQQASGKSSLYYFYNCRNRLVLAAKLLTLRQLVAWILTTPPEVRRVITRGAPSRRDRYGRALLAALRGCLAGLWWALRHRSTGRPARFLPEIRAVARRRPAICPLQFGRTGPWPDERAAKADGGCGEGP